MHQMVTAPEEVGNLQMAGFERQCDSEGEGFDLSLHHQIMISNHHLLLTRLIGCSGSPGFNLHRLVVSSA